MRRLFSLAMVAALIATAVMPASAFAGGPKVAFSATGTVATVDQGSVRPAGNSGRFVVRDRTVTGTLGGPDLVGPYTFVFDTNVPLATQAGQVHGRMTVGAHKMNVVGRSAPAEGPYLACLDLTCFDPGMIVPVVRTSLSGKVTFLEGAQGNGDFTASAWLIITLDGHIVAVLPGGVPLLDLSFSFVGVSTPGAVT
ncbi:MAG: hypothetical protein FJ315_02185, partial [SAR202 cluster bacterium]|nr:hypothetical protein [SAR202 cluster bacterium]